MKEIAAFKKAMKTMGAVFVETYEHTNPDGTVEERNRYAFIQKRVLGGIVFQLENSLSFTKNETLPKAGDRLERAYRRNKGDELSQLEIDRAEEWIVRLGEQILETERMLMAAVHAYEDITGESYYSGRKGSTTPVTDSAKAAAAILAKFAKKPEGEVAH